MIIETERLLLREFTADDGAAVLRYQSDERYQRFYPEVMHQEGQTRQLVQMFLDQQTVRPRHKFQWAITLKQSGQLIGNCGVRMAHVAAPKADIGYELDARFWGQGLATEAAAATVDFGFRELGVHRIWAECVAGNVRSARVLEKLGMQQEGQLRETQYFRGRWWDSLIYGLLSREWKKSGN